MSKKEMPKTTHVFPRGSTYYFRIRIPQDLLSHYKKAEISFSLKTKNHTEAKRKGLAEATRHLDEFERVRTATSQGFIEEMSPEEINMVTEEFYHTMLAGDDAERMSGKVSKSYRLGVDILHNHASAIAGGVHDYEGGDSLRWITKMTRDYLDGINLKIAPLGDLEKELIYKLSQVSLRAVEVINSRDVGKYAPTPPIRSTTVTGSLKTPPQPSHTHLSTVIELYANEQETTNAWTGKSPDEYRANFNLLKNIIGDLNITDLGYEHTRRFKETLRQLPANINKSPKYRGKSIPEILACPDITPMSIATVNKYLVRVSGLFDWCLRHGYVTQNYASKLLISQKGKKASESRDMFDSTHLEAIFKAISEGRVSSGNVHSFHYWAPLLGYFTAGRINEIASLRVTDFVTIEGVECISINQQNDGEKGTKTKSGERPIPLHPALIRLGLLRHVENLKSRGEIRLFPELKMSEKNGYGAGITRWFSSGHNSKSESFLWRDAGITDPKLVFHSFRHTMATQLERTEASDALTKRIMGHSLEGDVTHGRYSKGPFLRQLRKAIIKAVPETPLGNLPVFEEWRHRM